MAVTCERCVLSGRVSSTGRSLVQRGPTECDMSECDLEASIGRTHWQHKKKIFARPPCCCLVP
jgi:hypothetical protein